MNLPVAALLLAAAQVNVTTPPSQPTMPSPQDKAMEELRLRSLANEGDLHYLKRAEGRSGEVASAKEITASLDAYAALFARDRQDLDSRWKYLRSTYFKAEYTGLDDAQKAALYDRAKPVAEEAIDLLRKRAGEKVGRSPKSLEPQEVGRALAGDQSAAETFFWTAVNWGQWGLAHGKWAAARAGVASRVRDDSKTAIAIDPKLEDGGGYRVLGRLHAVSPKIPFVTGWIDREEAVQDLRQAVSIAPENLINQLFLAEALHEWTSRKSESADILRRVIAATPHPDHLVEDLHAQATARQDLERWHEP